MLTIITISYNSQHMLTRCLGPLIDSGVYPVLIIDNASTDHSAEALISRFPDAPVKALPKNIGYGRAANAGLDMVKTPYALLLNPDLVASADDIQRLLDHARVDHDNTAIWGPASQQSDFTHEPPQPVKWISGCAMLFNMEKLGEIGFFDENIFLFFEETDLCERALDGGFKIKLCKDVFFDHMRGQATTPSQAIEIMKNWHYGWSRCYYFNKRGIVNGKRNPKRQYVQYKLKSIFATTTAKRLKYKAQAEGALAFLKGKKAFLSDGSPQKNGSSGCKCSDR